MIIQVVIIIHKPTKSEYVDSVWIDDVSLVEGYIEETLKDLGKEYEAKAEPYELHGHEMDESW